MPSTFKQAEITAYESIRATPLTQVHGRPTHGNYKTLKGKACALASEVVDITYLWSKNATDDCGLLGDILGVNKYKDLTRILTYVIPTKPTSYNPTTTNAMLTHECKQREEDWDLVRTPRFIQKGFLWGIVDNLCDALDKKFYTQLKQQLTVYQNVTPYQILEDRNDRWCP
jgi:hypothetical protein